MSKLLKNSTIYIMMHFLQKSLGFLLLPLYTAFLSPTDYGIISIVNSIDTFLSILFSLSLSSAVVRLYYRHKTSPEYIKELWGTCITITVLMVITLLPLLLIFRNFIFTPFTRGISFYPYLLIGIISTALNPIYLLHQGSLQAKQEGFKFAINNVSFFISNILLTILFVVILNKKAEGVLLANLITNLIFFIISVIYFIPKIRIGINKNAAKESLQYSLPLLPHTIAGKINSTFDRIMINKMISTESAGLYNLGNQLSSIISTIALSVNNAFSPWFFEKDSMGKGNSQKVNSAAYMIIDIYILLGTGLSLFSKEIITIFINDRYFEVWKSLPILAFGSVFVGIYFVASNPLFLEKTKLVSFITISTASVNILLNFILIPKYSYTGAAVATLITQFLQSLITNILVLNNKSMRLNIFRIYSGAVIGMLISSSIWLQVNRWASLSLRIIIYFILLFIVYKLHQKTLLQLFKNKNKLKKNIA